MKAYHGTSISNLINLIRKPRAGLYVTDTRANASRYANVQATSIVSAKYTELAEGAVLVEVEVDDNTSFFQRPADHATLDTSEAYVRNFKVIAVEMKPHTYAHTLYGRRGSHMSYQQIVEMLEQHGISNI